MLLYDSQLELQPPGTCPVISEPQMAHPWRNLPEVSSTPSPSANSGETQREETMAGQVKMTPTSQVPVTSAPLTLLLTGSHQKYWVGQKVHLGFSITSFLNPNKFFGQPNREIMNTGVRQTSASNFHL